MTKTWPQIKLGDILTYLDRRIDLDDLTEYATITVKRRHGGLIEREKLYGHQIKTKKQFQLVPGAFIISRVQCWHQAYAIVPNNIPPNMIASSNYDEFAIASSVDPQFFWWYSHSPHFTETVRSSAFGVVIEKMVFNREAWLEKSIPLPPLDDQRRIVAKIEALSAKIEEAQKKRQRSIVEADALERSELATAFDALSVAHGTRPLNALITDAGYGTSVKCHYEREDHDVPVLRIPNVIGERVSFTDMKFGPLSDQELDRVTLTTGDILVVRTNGSADLVGRSAVVPSLEEPMAFASYMIRLRCDDSLVAPEYLQLILKHLRTQGDLIDFARTTAGQYNVSLGRLRAAEIPVPPHSAQRSLVERIAAVQNKVDKLKKLQEESAKELDALMPSILSKAFSGEL